MESWGDEMIRDPFEKYYREEEPGRKDRQYAWRTAIGLQAVDQLRPSAYLIETACRNIEGEINIKEAKALIDSYYQENPGREPERTEEADKVSARIAEVLSETSFVLAPTQYLSIHRRLFWGIYPHAGKIRDYNITKKEWVLNGDTVIYGGASELRDTLDYDFFSEREFCYEGLTMSEIIKHLALFISRLWQIHVFSEGNTRTTAVFFIKYLRTLGFQATNDVFAENAWYFRNALVRANYTNLGKGIHETTEYLELFLRNLLLGEHNELKNRYLHIDWNCQNQDIQSKKRDIGDKKQNIQAEKPDIKRIKQDIQTEKQDIESKKQHIYMRDELVSTLHSADMTGKTRQHILKLFDAFEFEQIFGRSDIVKILEISASAASALIRRMRDREVIESVRGIGKGKYRFRPF